MKQKDTLKELKGLSKDELVGRSKQLAEEKMKLRFRAASGQMDKSHLIKMARRNFARSKTLLRLKSLAEKNG